MSRLLRVEHLETAFPASGRMVKVVDDVSFGLDAGETVGIVGESGSGKSVTALSMMRLIERPGRIMGGQVVYGEAGDEADVLKMSDEELREFRWSQAAMVFQDPTSSLNPVMRIGEQIEESMLAHHRFGAEQADARVTKLLAQARVPDVKRRAHAYPHELSGGMRQRAMIAMALANEPKLIIADEPTTALDVTVQAEIIQLLRDINRDLGTAIILISHNLAVIASLCTRILVMYAGRVVEEGPTEQVLGSPQHPYTWSLLRAIPRLDGDRRNGLLSIPGRPPDPTRFPTGCRFHPRCFFKVDRCSLAEPELEQVEMHQNARCWVLMKNVSDEAKSRDAGIRQTSAMSGRTTDNGAVRKPGIGEVPSPLLELDSVVKDYSINSGLAWSNRVRAVDGVSLRLTPGETLGLVGETGCGKSTLARLITRIQPTTRGSIRFMGRDVHHLHGGALRQMRRNMQLVFQDPYSSLDPRMSVQQIVGEPVDNLERARPSERNDRVRELLDICGLPANYLSRYPHELSGGQRQRVAIARALISNPRLVIADEPVSALDVSIQAQVINLLSDLQDRFQLTYLFISHDLAVVRHLAHEVAVMYLGKIVEFGKASDLYEAPLHPYTVALLSSIPTLEADGRARPQTVRLRGDIASPTNIPRGCRFHTRCPIARPICADREPPLAAPAGKSRVVACHFPGEA